MSDASFRVKQTLQSVAPSYSLIHFKTQDIRELLAEHEKLELFKRLCHKILDESGVPTFDGEECRIGARLRYQEAKLDAALADAERLAEVLQQFDTLPEVEAALTQHDALKKGL